MATAAFKSNTRRGNEVKNRDSSANLSSNRLPRRRSLSVSAVARAEEEIPSEFSNMRDNPLFWSKDTSVESPRSESKDSSTIVGQRGRSVTRNSGLGSKDIGRSLSRVDNGHRGRPVTRGGSAFVVSESEAEQESIMSSTNQSRNNSYEDSSAVKRPVAVSNSAAAMQERMRSLQWPSDSHRSSPNPTASFSSNMQSPSCEDGISNDSLSEAEEKTIKAVYEQIKTIRRNNPAAVARVDIADLPPDLVKPGAVELVLDIRREYAKKLEESQERAMKLRSGLAVEEHRSHELSRILKETLPDPKSSAAYRSRPRRRTSSERKKLSKHLAEEAMSYFDECVSISTFDSSDFSAAEDSVLGSVGVALSVDGNGSLPQGIPSISSSCVQSSRLDDNQVVYCTDESISVANTSSKESVCDRVIQRGTSTVGGRKPQFSFCNKPNESLSLQQDIQTYIRNFEKEGGEGGTASERSCSDYFDFDAYELSERADRLMCDRVLSRNRLESGSLHVCGGGIAIPFSRFASPI